MENNKETNETLELKKIVIGYLRQWKLILGVFIFAVILGIIYLIIIPRTYEIMARIRIQDMNESGQGVSLGEAAGIMQSFGIGSGSSATINIDDEISTLVSNKMLRQMVLELGLNMNYMKPGAFKYKMYKESPLLLTSDSATAMAIMDEIQFKVNIDSRGAATVKMKSGRGSKTMSFSSLPAVISMPEGNVVLQYRKNKVYPYKMKIKMLPVSWVAEGMANDFLVEEYSKASTVIEMTCQDYNRQRGKDMLNTLINDYNKSAMDMKNSDAQHSLDFINGRLTNVTNELSNTENEIKAYKTKNQMTDIEYDVQFYTNEMQELQSKIIELESETHLIDIMNSYVKDPANKNSLVPMLIAENGGEMSSSPLTAYNNKLLERSSLMQSAKKNNPLIVQADQQIDKLRESVKISFANSQKSIKLALGELKSKENLLMSKMGSVPSVERDYVEMKRNQEISQGVYLILFQKREDLMLTLGQQKNKAVILDDAFVKMKSIAPRKLYAAIGVAVFTIVVPIFILMFMALFRSLRTEYKREKSSC